MEKEQMIGELARLVGKENVLSSAMHFKLYEYDASLNRSKPDCIVLPTSTEQVAKVVKFAYDNRIPIIARGTGTNLSGGAFRRGRNLPRPDEDEPDRRDGY